MNKKNSIQVATDKMYATITSTTLTDKTPEWLKDEVISQTKKELNVTDVSFNDSEWKKIARAAYKNATKTPKSFINLQAFCYKNPAITAWFYTTCGTVNGMYNFVTFYTMCGINSALILAGKNTWTKQETVKYLTEKMNEFLAHFSSDWTVPSDYIFDDMLLHIATACISTIKATTPEVLETIYTEMNKTNTMMWDMVKETVDSCLTTYYNNVIIAWPINNPKVAEPATA